jgi:hypothetical protein
VRRIVAVTLLAAASLTGLATPASACTGVVCDTICDAWNSKLGQRVFGDTCPLR